MTSLIKMARDSAHIVPVPGLSELLGLALRVLETVQVKAFDFFARATLTICRLSELIKHDAPN